MLYNVWGCQPHAADVTCNVWDVNGSLYWESHQSCIRLQIGAGIYVVPTADAVATGDVSCHNCIIGHSEGFRRRPGRGTVEQHNDP